MTNTPVKKIPDDASFDLRGCGRCYRILQKSVQCNGESKDPRSEWETHACQHSNRRLDCDAGR